MQPTDQEKLQNSRPRQVTVAVYLIYASLAVTILHSLVEPLIGGQAATELAASPFFYLALAIFVLFPIFIATNIAAGRNWARQLYSAGTFLYFFYVAELMQGFDDSPVITTLGTIPLLLQLMAIVLLFQRPSSGWFRSNKAGDLSKKEPAEKLAENDEETVAADGVASSGSSSSNGRVIALARYVAIAAAAGAGIGLMNGLFWYRTAPPQSGAEREFVSFLILTGMALGGILGATAGFLLLQFARRKPNRTLVLWAVMGGVFGGVCSLGCCFFVTALSFI